MISIRYFILSWLTVGNVTVMSKLVIAAFSGCLPLVYGN
jgi:hypothetical protein